MAAQTLATGTGGVNVDACRVATTAEDRAEMLKMSQGFAGRKWAEPHMANYGYEDSMPTKTVSIPHASGRWPPNVLLVHGSACKRAGTREVKPKDGHRVGPVREQADGDIRFTRKPVGYQKTGYTDPSGTETVAAWDCELGCPARALDALSGERPVSGKAALGQAHTAASPGFGGGWADRASRSLPNDSGGASRFFPQFADIDELLGWVARLITPEWP